MRPLWQEVGWWFSEGRKGWLILLLRLSEDRNRGALGKKIVFPRKHHGEKGCCYYYFFLFGEVSVHISWVFGFPRGWGKGQWPCGNVFFGNGSENIYENVWFTLCEQWVTSVGVFLYIPSVRSVSIILKCMLFIISVISELESKVITNNKWLSLSYIEKEKKIGNHKKAIQHKHYRQATER